MTLLRMFGLVCVLLGQSALAQTALAQDAERDDEARTAYQTAVTAYEDGDMDLALTLFQRAYDLSPRPQLLYNIGSTAERLGRAEQAIESYAAFVEALPEHEKADFARGRLEDLRSAESSSGANLGLAVGLPLAIAGAALAGVGIVGALTASGCTERNAADVCVEERTGETGPIAAYIGVGAAAFVAGLTWLIVASTSEDDVQVGFGPTSVSVRGRF